MHECLAYDGCKVAQEVISGPMQHGAAQKALMPAMLPIFKLHKRKTGILAAIAQLCGKYQFLYARALDARFVFICNFV